MNRSVRIGALAILAAALLVFHGLMVPVAHTFAFGDSATAEIAECHISNKSTICTGTWEVNGQEQSGRVVGANTSDEGEPVAIRTGFFGAYTDNFHAHFWGRAFPGIIADITLVAVFFGVRYLYRRGAQALERLRADTDGRSQLFVFEAKAIGELGGAVHYSVKDVDSATTQLLDSLGNPIGTFTGQRLPHNLSRITVTRDGVGHGYLDHYLHSQVTNLHDPQGNPAGTVKSQSHYGVPGSTFFDGNGNPVALTLIGGRRLVARIPRDAPDWWRTLVFAHMVVSNWLTTPAQRRNR